MYQLAFIYYLVYFFLIAGVSFYSIRLFYTRNYLVNNKRTPRIILFIVLLLLIVFAASGDYWTYRKWYDTGFETEHYEPIWDTIRLLIPWSFDFFRWVLWGGALVLFTIMCRLHKSELLIAFPLFALFYMNNFSYARATIGYMLILYAYFLIIRIKRNHYHSWLILLPVIACCLSIGFQMHRSMPLLLAILAASFFLKPHKNIIIGLLIFFPVISLALNTIVFPYVMNFVADDDDRLKYAEYYLADERGFNFFIRLILFIHLPFLLLYFVSFMNIIKKEKDAIVRKIAFVAFLIVYSAFLFYTIKEGNGLTLFYRTLNMAYPFMIMSVAYSTKYLNNHYKLTLIIVLYQALFSLQAMLRIIISPDSLYKQVYERYIM